ncbi:4-hydroxy-tetrahydrodipicolinate synthase [Anaerosphaera aminiphila DSM 21120]|uniref:4-hydroxy-tetrahydrodipicolinate synthase n=1 Tax=Anaerosphaera aminiphila DSM 21120 TaxID=1120995 RepID=A0A1M5PPU3_9FIRM|nr:4-hydroxy-tetrahydrodipicolinate synthase [Anaerosphaera aminiphila]SHH03559.1 4-hydroxy-tetrahydrodipicolinate synthase [Anaerosphaera aminiphila DSM 21120]
MAIFKGSGVALVTPFKENGDIDFKKLEELLEFHVKNHTDAIVITGTTGEASTLNDTEHLEAIKCAVDVIDGRIPVIAGTGSNDTRHGINLSVEAEKLGADALLQVTPYYNKTSQKGLEEHFLAIANSVNIPILLYDVPGRTNMPIAPETLKRLAEHKNIVGIKDATGNLGHTIEIRRVCGEDFQVYSGNDDVVVPLLAAGGLGVISVSANIIPKETSEMVHLFLEGKTKEALEIQVKYKKFIDALFVEPNPIPVKAAMNMLGFEVGGMRLPLYEASDSTKELLKNSMKEINLL